MRRARGRATVIFSSHILADVQEVCDTVGIERALSSRSTLGGGETVGALVCFIDGKAFKSGYRRFKIRTVQGTDDYAMIGEVVGRRLRRIAPDLDVIAICQDPEAIPLGRLRGGISGKIG